MLDAAKTNSDNDDDDDQRQSLVFTEDCESGPDATANNGGSARSSAVYNPTTVPLMRSGNKNGSSSSQAATALRSTTNHHGGDPNELGIPLGTATTTTATTGPTSIHRWLPKAQRSLLQKQAELFVPPTTTTTSLSVNGNTMNGVDATATKAAVIPFRCDGDVVDDVGDGNDDDDTVTAAPAKRLLETDIF